jgi:hypothetical protein
VRNCVIDYILGVFTPCKNCNIETGSRDYATVDEVVFSPCRAEVCRAFTSRASPRIAIPRSLLGDTLNAWMTQGWGMVTWPPRVPQWRNSRRALFCRVSDRGLIGESGARLQAVLGEFSAWVMKILRVNRRPNLFVTFGVWDCGSLCVEIRC